MMVNLLTLPPPSDKTIVSLIWQQIWQARCTNLFVVEESLCLMLSLSLSFEEGGVLGGVPGLPNAQPNIDFWR